MTEDSRKNKKQSYISTGVFKRNLKVAKLSFDLGVSYVKKSVKDSLGIQTGQDSSKLVAIFREQAETISRELGKLKGGLLKAGQMLAMYGEYFLPEEVCKILRSMQNDTSQLPWAQIEKKLKREFGTDVFEKFRFDEEPLGTASLGQVHLAKQIATGLRFCFKVQYPGARKSVDSDVNTLKKLLELAKLLPVGDPGDELFKEIRYMLNKELDYEKEKETTDYFREVLKEDRRFAVPETIPKYCTKQVITTTFMEGVDVTDEAVLSLPIDRRNKFAEAALELFFMELFVLGVVQTDPHFGNYRVRVEEVHGKDQLVLLDFGATRKLSRDFLRKYISFIKSLFTGDNDQMDQAMEQLGIASPEDTDEQKLILREMCSFIIEPYTQGASGRAELWTENSKYLWGKTDIPKKLMKVSGEAVFKLKLRPPPRECVFLNRKMAGVFIFLNRLDAELDPLPLMKEYLDIGIKKWSA